MKKIYQNQEVLVKHILGETAANITESLGNGKYRFLVDAYCEGETCQGGFFHLRQAIEAKPGKKVTDKVTTWPRLRKALQAAGVQPVNIPGGDAPLHYDDEIAVPDFSRSGAHYFIVARKDIDKFLASVPLDEQGKKRRAAIKAQRAAAEAEAYRQTHDPQCIAKRIGDQLWNATHDLSSPGGSEEFVRLTMESADGASFSVMYPSWGTDLIASLWCTNVAKVVCEAEEQTGLKYLNGIRAGKIDPRNHCRIKKVWSSGWNRGCAYLMPLAGLADEIREDYRWLAMFDTADNDGVDPKLIAEAKRVILETFDLYDQIDGKRLVYEAETQAVHVEYLHNKPKTPSETPVWRPEKPTVVA